LQEERDNRAITVVLCKKDQEDIIAAEAASVSWSLVAATEELQDKFTT
jgi:hypothetical protein